MPQACQGAIVDCSRSVMVLKTVDAALMRPLKKSSTGHLLIDLCDNWLQGGSRIFFHSDMSVEEKRVQFADTAYMVREVEGERGRAVFHGDQSMRHQEFHEDQCMSHHVFHGDHNMHAQVCHDDHDLSHQVFHGDSTISQTESRETWNVETCMQLLNEGERGELSRLDESQRDEWLANIFAVRLEDQQNLSSPNPADSAQQGMSLRLLAWLATAPLLTTSDSWCHVVQWQQGQGEEPIFEDRAQGEQGRQIRLVADLRTRPEGSEMQRSPCARCKLRLSYTPSWGAHALTRKPGALPADVEKQVDELQENAAYRLKLRDKDIGLDGAEKSCLNQLEKIKAQKAAYNKDKPAAAPQTEGPIMQCYQAAKAGRPSRRRSWRQSRERRRWTALVPSR